MKIINNQHKLIVFEGRDGCGKTSVIKKVSELLEKAKLNYDILISSNEGKYFVELAKTGSQGLDRKLALYLFWLQRRSDVLSWNKLEKPTIILQDRYNISTQVYNINDDEESLLKHNYDPNYFPIPDLNIYLDCSLETILSRKEIRKNKKDLFDTENAFEEKCRYEKYLKIISNGNMNSVVVSSEQPLDHVAIDCFHKILNILE